MITGRTEELQTLKELYKSEYSEFAAVYGRRRVGKTFLVREAFNYSFTFQHTGVAKENKMGQLAAFRTSLMECGLAECPELKEWADAFNQLKVLIRSSKKKKKVIFIDEISWMDTRNSKLVSALEHFWNSWASARKDVLLIICASATSWVINKVLRDRGGLHKRVGHPIHLDPFSLKECREYLESKKFSINDYQIILLYMAMGGPAYYWSLLSKSKSAAQNIDALFFSENGILKSEFNDLYDGMFSNPVPYKKIITALGESATNGLTRQELIEKYKFVDNGDLSTWLEELQECGFIRRYTSFGKKKKDTLYQLIDNYTLFHFKFILKNENDDEHFWTNSIGSSTQRAWCRLAFERVCLQHIKQIKTVLGIGAVSTNQCSWRSDPDLRSRGEKGAQIDLLIDRKDDVVNICEMKWYAKEYLIDSDDEESIRNKVAEFISETGTKKAVHVTMVTMYGVKANKYSDGIQSFVSGKDLFII